MYNRKKILLVSSGDLRISANQEGWKFQETMEQKLELVLEEFGYQIVRAHSYDKKKRHGFIDSQKMGIQVFKSLESTMPIIIAESVWQYSHHVLPGLMTHEGPILTLANWEGISSGLVGMLNLNGSLTKAGVSYSTLWSKDFQDDFFREKLRDWLKSGKIVHDSYHVKSYHEVLTPESLKNVAATFAKDFLDTKAIMGVFDEGCMGMFNAIVPDHLLNRLGIFKERLSQSALYAEILTIGQSEAQQVLDWLMKKGMKFHWGTNPNTELTREQTLEQCKIYIAAIRIAAQYGCDTIGIQYQQGLKDLTAASDLAEGLLNNVDRPPVYDQEGNELYTSDLVPHFNEVDECAGIDALITTRLWKTLGLPPETTLHDVRWGEEFKIGDRLEFVWVFLISGAAPPAHFIDGYQGASSERQPPMYFKKGGGSLKGISKPGYIVWSRIFIEEGELCCDLGVGEAVELPEEETNRRWENTTPAWPIMHVVLPGISRNQFMGRHKANHIQVVYADSKINAIEAAKIKASVFNYLGIKTFFCGELN